MRGFQSRDAGMPYSPQAVEGMICMTPRAPFELSAKLWAEGFSFSPIEVGTADRAQEVGPFQTEYPFRRGGCPTE